MGLRVCAEPGCPELQDAARCLEHRRGKERARGTRQQRGYDAAHAHERASIQRAVDRGAVVRCVTCGLRLTDRAWDLGHDASRTKYIGPQCIPCNRGHRDPR